MKTPVRSLALMLCLALSAAPASAVEKLWEPVNSLDDLGRNYVLLVLRLEKHIPGFNDYYYGPADWKERVDAEEKISTEELRRETAALLAALDRVGGRTERRHWFRKQLIALDTNLRQLEGEKFSIADQARLLYDLNVTPPAKEELDAAGAELERLLPGSGSLAERLDAWRNQFRLADEKLPEAYRLALEVARKHTRELLLLPANEKVDLTFVTNKSWGAYNWFQGNARSRIEVNTDLPASASAIFDFVAHEAYPGHHTELTTREQRLYRERGYLEWCVSPLFTPMGTVSEAIAEAGREIVLTPEEKLAWHRDLFFPALGITDVDAERWMKITAILAELKRARERVPFMLLEEGNSEEEVVAYLQKYTLVTPEQARKFVDFTREWGAYTFNYTVGREILLRYLVSGNARAKFVQLLTTPVTPSLVEEWIRTGAQP